MTTSAIIALIAVCITVILAVTGGVWTLATALRRMETRIGERLSGSLHLVYQRIDTIQSANQTRFDCHQGQLSGHAAELHSMRRLCDERHRRRLAQDPTTALVKKDRDHA